MGGTTRYTDLEAANFRDEQLRRLYGNTPATMLLLLVLALVNAVVYRDALTPDVLGIWVGAVVALSLLRLWFWRGFLNEPVIREDGWRWALVYHVLGTTLGLIFSAGVTYILVFVDPVDRLFGLVSVFGVATAATLRITHVKYLLPMYTVAVIGPPVVVLTYLGEPHATALLWTSAFFIIFLIFFSVEHLKMIRDHLAVGLRNQRLIRLLAEANRELEREAQPATEPVTDEDHEVGGVIANLQDLLFRISPNGQILSVSSSIRHVLDMEPEDIIGEPLATLMADADDIFRFQKALDSGGGRVSFFKLQVRHGSGADVWLSANAHHVYDEDGRVRYIEGTARDVSALVETERQLEEERERAETTLASIGDGVMTVDHFGLITSMNPAAEALTGWSAKRAIGERVRRVAVMLDRHTRRPARDYVKECLKNRRRTTLAEDIILVGAHGKESSVELQLAPLQQGAGAVAGVALVMHDVTRMRDMASQLRYQAAHDGLTGLINRVTFEQQLESALASARDEGAVHALMYIDLDQFKIINDTCGHVAGDELLKQLALRLASCIRDSDTLARLGGDEFGVLLERCPLEQAREVGEKLRQAVRSYRYVWKDKVFEIGASIGLVPITVDSGTISDVLSGADAACYVAKDRGRNRIHVFHPADTDVAERKGEMQWIQVIQQAWDHNSFELYYQPIVPLQASAKSVNTCEFLLRLRRPGGELERPTVFLPAAERYHMMPQMDRWVLRRALAIISARPVSLRELNMFCINLSGQSLSDETFLDFVIEELDRSEVPPQQLCFEITETAVVANLARATRFISILRGMGCKFSLDDFGSGLSSFRYLKDLPADYLKIDGTFIRRIDVDNKDCEMVKVINQIGSMMNIQTVAEYVESESILNVIKELRVDFAQGNYIGEPRPI